MTSTTSSVAGTGTAVSLRVGGAVHLHQIELFCKVVEWGSFTRAAEELFITPGALRIQVKRLERGLGVVLLQRVPGGMAPTEVGREVYAMGRGLLDLQQTFGRRVAGLRQGTTGTVRIGVTNTAPLYYVAEVLRDFVPAHPQVSVTVDMDKREPMLDALARGSLDLAVDWAPIVHTGLITEPLLEEPWVIVAAPRHPLAALPVLSCDQLADAPFLTLQLSPLMLPYDELALNAVGVRPKVVMRLPFIDAVKRLVEAGLGIALIGRRAAELELAAGRLIALTVEGFSCQQLLVLARPDGRIQSAAVENFVRFLRQHAQRHTPSDDAPRAVQPVVAPVELGG
jgi:LysR family transcriptional regulator, low CO2-responsive transcriptional regulator